MNNDLISRSALLEKAVKPFPDALSSMVSAWDIVHAPAVDAGPTWISVKDRLPEDEVIIDGDVYYRDVVVAFRDPNYPPKVAYCDKALEVWLQPLDFRPLENVTHWMPLPEPPKEG